MDSRSASVLVMDIGGSHMAAGLFDPQSSCLGEVHELRLLPGGECELFFAAFESLAGSTLPAPSRPTGIAIAIPSPFDYANGISLMRHKFQSLYGVDLRGEIARRLGCAADHIHFLNDAAASLLGEMQHGAARGAQRVVSVTLGTGVGSAFSVNGDIVVEGAGVPADGEIWNQPYRDGIVEDYISTDAIQRTFEELTGKRLPVCEIATSTSHRQEAQQAFERFGRELGFVLRQVNVAFGPDRIVLGGGITRAADRFLPIAKAELGEFRTRLFVSELLERAPLIGAGISWLKRTAAGSAPLKREET